MNINISPQEQEKLLDEAYSTVTSQAVNIKKCIEDYNLRQCLKETSTMLIELKTPYLSPKNYYHLFTAIFDQMLSIENCFKDEYKRGRDMIDLYDSVQQASNIIPRLYLLITVGSVLISSQVKKPKEVLNELLMFVKGIQNPLRGLFLRYYLLKMTKDILPDTGNEYCEEGGDIEDTTKFILQNLEEMNRLWIRLSMGCTGNEKNLKEKERTELKVLVGENIVRLSSLNGLTADMYKSKVLPEILNILLESRDALAQHYLMDCIIFAFPNDFNIRCMSQILDTCTKLLPSVDIKSLFINLMDKLEKIVIEVKEAENVNFFFEESEENVFDLLRQNIDKIIKEQSSDNYKLLELLVAFLKFTIKCNPNKVVHVNHILSSACNILSMETGQITHDGIKFIVRLLTIPLESLSFAIFEMNQYPVLMGYLDFPSKKTLAMKIVESLTKSKESLTSKEKVTRLLEFIKCLLIDTKESIESDVFEFEYEQQNIAKLVFLIENEDYRNILEMFALFKDIIAKGGLKRMKINLPTLLSAYLLLASKLSYGYYVKKGNTIQESMQSHFNNFVNTEASFETDEDYVAVLKKIYNIATDLIGLVSVPYPELSFRLNIEALNNLNDLKVLKEEFEEHARNFCENAFTIYSEEIGDQEVKIACLQQLVGTLINLSILGKENYSTFITNLIANTSKYVKRADQTLASMICAILYFNKNVQDTLKVKESLLKAKKFAEYSMTNPQNITLFIILLNKYIYYVEKECGTIDQEMFNDILDSIKNHFETIRTENREAPFLSEAERFLQETLETLGKKAETKEFYKQLNLN
jgi:vacuolar protein sorting-associated protein 35